MSDEQVIARAQELVWRAEKAGSVVVGLSDIRHILEVLLSTKQPALS